MNANSIAVDYAQADTPVAYLPELKSSDSISQHDGWVMSFIDLLLLLLTLFVLLLSFKNGGDTPKISTVATNAEPKTRPVVQQDSFEVDSSVYSPVALSTLNNPPSSQPVTESNVILKPQDNQQMMLNDIFEKLSQNYAQQDSAHNEVQISTTTNKINIEISEAILFKPANDDLTPRGELVLQQLARVLVDYPFRLSVEGHTDNIPISSSRFPSNWELSTSRATKVTRKLIDDGYPTGSIRSIGYGDTQPLADNKTAEGRAKNRRVSIILEQPDTGFN